VADYRGLVNAAKAGRSRPHRLQLIASIAVEGRKFRTCLGIPLWGIRDRVEPAAIPAMSATLPNAEVNSGH
jgi:hypothetical protein